MMLCTKYQGSKPYGFRQEDFFYVFPYIGLYNGPREAIFGPKDKT